MNIKLRPHHLLCTQSYIGKGYSDEFVENMDSIVARLREESDAMVDITLSTDDICEKCPLMLEKGVCTTNEKVTRLDSKVMEYFGVCEKTYNYDDIIREVNQKLNATTFEEICGSCEWFSLCQDIFAFPIELN